MFERTTKQIAAHASELTDVLLAAARGFEVSGYPPGELIFNIWTELTDCLLEDGWTVNELCELVRDKDDGEDKA